MPVWETTPNARSFVRWVTSHPIVVHEQGLIAHLLWQRATAERPEDAVAYETERKRLIAATGQENSTAIVMDVPREDGKEFTAPWCVE